MTEEEEVEVENCHMLITSLLNEGAVIKMVTEEDRKSDLTGSRLTPEPKIW
jgi:phosphosulfolactate phosphohydrolase-like enzyme